MAPMLPPDIILLICEELGNQRAFGTLFNAALSSKNLAGSALLWMYRVHGQASIRGGESNEDDLSKTEQLKTASRWASEWRSIILSSLGQTAYPYCLYIRYLDLSDLEELVKDTLLKKELHRQFFEGRMKEFLKVSERTRSKGRLSTSAIVNMIGTSICRYAGDAAERHGGTAALEELSGEIEKDLLPEWAGRLPRLNALTLWNGHVLTEAVADVIKANCPDFDTLTIYHCRGESVDADLASFFATLRCNTLHYLQVLSHHDLGISTFISLNNHLSTLKHLELNTLTSSAIKALPFLKGCTSIQRLVLEDAEGRIDLEVADDEILMEIIAWLSSCKQLKVIHIEGFVNGPRILTSVCLENAIQLDSLLLTKYPLTGNQDFHRALVQQTSLKSLHLNADAEDSFRDDIDTLVTSLCKLENLLSLNVLDTSDYFQTSEVQLLAMHLSKLEDFSVGGYHVTDEVWRAISTLPNLRSLSFHAVTSFTLKGILNYISTLRPTNAGLQLSVMCAALESELNPREIAAIRDALVDKVKGKFDFELYRDRDAGSSSVSDSD